ncbi:hypothetical protein BZG36_04573 [Bifiguratus adelaidae]|uniref:Protein transport protein SEC24 n=1 Tax=Bifiguratus adelaidae TaxID=1938954 RepID=A0A261XUR0_9FUNG|nr:hypothetical protein BZG36_04573 [Bifiguratus adelaidae]
MATPQDGQHPPQQTATQGPPPRRMAGGYRPPVHPTMVAGQPAIRPGPGQPGRPPQGAPVRPGYPPAGGPRPMQPPGPGAPGFRPPMQRQQSPAPQGVPPVRPGYRPYGNVPMSPPSNSISPPPQLPGQPATPQSLSSPPPLGGSQTSSTPHSPLQSRALPASPTLSTASSQAHEAHRRKRLYPEQITSAYMDNAAGSQFQPAFQAPAPYDMTNGAVTTGQQGQFHGGQPAPQFQQGFQGQQSSSQFTSPAGQARPPSQPYGEQPGMGGYGQQGNVNAGPQQGYPPSDAVHGGMAGLNSQFAGMSVGVQPKSLLHVPLIGQPPHIDHIDLPPPPIQLPPNVSITPSPKANCDPSYQRCTVTSFPATTDLLKKSKLPLALVLSPYRSLQEGDDPVPVVTDTVIARCRRCRLYIHPFVTFVEGGQRWRCNMCGSLNDVPSSFDYDVVSQKPVDRWSRPELNHGVVEFIAPTEYMVRPPQPPAYLFIIDVSFPAVQSGVVATVARAILESLHRLPNTDDRTKIGFITVDSSLHFYNLNAGATEPQMLVVGDVDDVFLPSPADLLVNLSECREAVETLLNRLGDMFKDNTNVGNALGPALESGMKLMESSLLNPASPFYKAFAVECSRTQLSVDMFIFGQQQQYSDVATLSNISRYTGGQTYFYPAFSAARSEDAIKFAHEFSSFLAEEVGLEAVLRVRCSKGVTLNSFHGNFFVRSTDLAALPNVPRDQNYCVELGMDDNITAKTVCIQSAILGTTCHGERRVRVCTICLPVTNSISELYAGADQFAIATLLANKAVERSLSSKLEDARDAVTNKVVDMLGVYRSAIMGSGAGSAPQLNICANLELLPLLALGLIKHVGLRQSSTIPTDLRSNAQNLLKSMPVQLLIPYLVPRFYSLHNMPVEAGTFGEDGLIMPPPLNLTAEKLERFGCFMLEDGQNIFLWLGREVVPQLCIDLFDVPSYEQVRPGKITMPTLDNPFSERVRLIIGKTREMRRGNYYPQLYLVKEDGEPALRLWFLSHLIEDRTDSLMSYYQWLGHLKDKELKPLLGTKPLVLSH